MNGYLCVLIKLYLETKGAGQICPWTVVCQSVIDNSQYFTKVTICKRDMYLLLLKCRIFDSVLTCVQVTYLGKELVKYVSEEIPVPSEPNMAPQQHQPCLPGTCRPTPIS